MQRIVKVLAVTVLVATVLVVASVPAFARPLRGGVPLNNAVCDVGLVGNHGLFVERNPNFNPPEDPSPVPADCWHLVPGLLKQFEDS